MAWETRGGRKYFYTGRRVNGRVVKEYHGSGPISELTAQAVEQRKVARRKVRARIKAERESLKAIETIMEQQNVVIDAVIGLQTRRLIVDCEERGMSTENSLTGQEAIAKLRRLLNSRTPDDPSTEAEIRLILNQFPELWPQLGDLGEHAIKGWIGLIGRDDVILKEAILHKSRELQSELAGGADDPASRLLVDRVVATWMQLQYADLCYADARDVDVKGMEFLAKRQLQAQRQHFSALQAWRQFAANSAGFGQSAPTVPAMPEVQPPETDDEEAYILPFRPRAVSA